MAYKAIITPIVNIREHPNADRIALGTAANFQVIVGLNQKEGELGIFFPTDGKLMRDHLLANKLYRKHPDTNQPMKGYFEAKGRVRAQKFRGEMSEGFWEPLECLNWTGDISYLKHGDLVDEVNGNKICAKYYTAATKRMMAAQKKQKRIVYETFKEHWDTKQVRNYINNFPQGAVITISTKAHGTSGRTGHVYAKRGLNRFQRLWNRFMPLKFSKGSYVYVSGTRRVVLDTDSTEDIGYYSGMKFRHQVHEKFKRLEIPKNTVWYYELCGWTDTGKAIMPFHRVEDKELRKVFGDEMVYKYGCDPNDPDNCYRILVYRITVVNEDGETLDLPVSQIKSMCARYGLETVPYIKGPFIYNGDPEEIVLLCKTLSTGLDPLDPSHIREGVVLRVEHETGVMDYKWKNQEFCELEGIAKNEDFIDPEDVS